MRINYHLGKNMRHALRFYSRCSGWHSYAKDTSTRPAIERLASIGLLEVNEFQQARITWKGTLVRAQMDAE